MVNINQTTVNECQLTYGDQLSSKVEVPISLSFKQKKCSSQACRRTPGERLVPGLPYRRTLACRRLQAVVDNESDLIVVRFRRKSCHPLALVGDGGM